MTVADDYTISKLATNGTTKTFTFGFYTYSKEYVKVIKETDGVQTLVQPTDYTIKLNNSGGNVIFTVAPASGSYIIIMRATPQEQETSFATSSGFPAKTVEGRFDKLTSMIQETQDSLNRTASFPVGTELNVTLPLPESGKAIMWNENADGLKNSNSTFDDIMSTSVAAKDAAIEAQGKAETAQTAAETAQGKAETAQGKSEAAQTAAENAVSGFDDYVAEKKAEFDPYIEDASDYASAAAQSANDAHDSELAAAASESNASDYKDLAYTYSQNAAQSANDAQTEADNIRAALDGYATLQDLPIVNDNTLTIQKNGSNVGTFTANSASDKTINLVIPTTASDVGALASSTPYGASISLSVNSSTYVVTAQLKDQNGNNLGSAATIDLPLESVVVSGTYNDETKEIVLRLQSGATIEIPVADLVAGLQSEITSDDPLDADLVDDSTSTNKFVTTSDKTAWNGKQDALGYTAENSANKVTSLSSASTDTQYPSAKCVYDELGQKADSSDIPTDTGDLTNNAGFITISDATFTIYRGE